MIRVIDESHFKASNISEESTMFLFFCSRPFDGGTETKRHETTTYNGAKHFCNFPAKERDCVLRKLEKYEKMGGKGEIFVLPRAYYSHNQHAVEYPEHFGVYQSGADIELLWRIMDEQEASE